MFNLTLSYSKMCQRSTLESTELPKKDTWYLMSDQQSPPLRPSSSTQWRATRPGQGQAATPTTQAAAPASVSAPTQKPADTRKEDFFWDGDIVLTLKHARGVIAADVSGTSDPYCKVFLTSEKDNVPFIDGYKTKIHWKTLNPDWNEVDFRIQLSLPFRLSLLL